MKQILKFNFLIFLSIVFTTLSCKKSFIEPTPPTSVDPAVALGTEADIKNALFGTYASLRAVDYYGRTLVMIGDVMSDNAFQHTTNTNRYTLFNNYTFNVTDANVLGLWGSCYSTILRANKILDVTLPASAALNQYKGEAYALRALSYFTLVRYFARPYTDNPSGMGVPIVLHYDAFAKPGRSSVADVYTQIIADLNQAFSLMTTYSNSSQFSKYAAKALLAKVLLTKGNDMANAKAAALDVITNGGFTLVNASGHSSYWSNGAFRVDKVETIFEVSSDAVSNLAFDALSYLYSQNGNYGDFLITTGTNGLYPLFSPTDVRYLLYPQVRRPKNTGPILPTIDKYPVITGDYSDSKVLRLSEMYLIAAEASLPANEVDALTYVNIITANRNAAPIVSTGPALYEDIITERRRELAFEGDRYFDLLRLKRDVVRSTNYPSAARTVLYSNFRRILPIPQSELDANPVIKGQQNPGYQ